MNLTLEDWANIATVVTGVAATIGAGVAVITFWQWQINVHQLGLQTMTHFHDRYDRLHSKLHELSDEKVLYKELQPGDRNTISLYINMCSEQFYWKSQGRIDKSVWMVWQEGMKEQFQVRAIRVAWTEKHQHETYYNGFREFVIGTLLA